MKVNIISQKLIKPCTPTPKSLCSYNISHLDEINWPTHICIILYYPSKPEKISQLEESLAKILPQFYPLAGRYIKKDHVVDCSDVGAEFLQAEAIAVRLCDVVEKITTLEQLHALLPPQYYRVDEAATTPLLSVQITGFQCGGVAMSVSISHRIFDLSSVATFITAWRNANNPAGGGEILPSFDGPSLFPAQFNPAHNFNLETFPELCVKRFVFNKEAIGSLRSKLKPSSNGRAISRVGVVSALMSKALIRLDRAKHGISRACVIMCGINIRERTIPPLPNHSCGSFVMAASTPRIAADESKDMGIQDLVDVIREGMEKTFRECSKLLLPGADRGKIFDDWLAGFFAKLGSGDVNVIAFTDWSKFGFGKADFGWGKPVWASIGPFPTEKTMVLMENKEGDGIEAWVYLKENDVAYIEQDEDIRCFAT